MGKVPVCLTLYVIHFVLTDSTDSIHAISIPENYVSPAKPQAPQDPILASVVSCFPLSPLQAINAA